MDRLQKTARGAVLERRRELTTPRGVERNDATR
jgi:hypothetical protein